MPGEYAYTIRLNDLMSGQLHQTSRTAKGAFSSIDQGNRKAQQSTRRSGQSINDLRNRLRRLQQSRDASFDPKQIRSYNKQIRNTEQHLQRLQDQPPRSFMDRMQNLPGWAKAAATSIGSIFAVSGLSRMSSGLRDATAEYEGLQNAIELTTGSSEAQEKAFEDLSDAANKYGVSLEAAEKGFQQFSAGMMGMDFSPKEQIKMFEDASKAISVANLNAEDAQIVYEGLGRIMGKGRVSAEELRMQIGERLPFAGQAAARSMNMEWEEFVQKMERGEIQSRNFIQGFTSELGKMAEPGIEDAMESLNAQISRQQNEQRKLVRTIGMDLLPAQAKWVNLKTKGLEVLQATVSWMRENGAVIKGLTGAVVTATTSYAAYRAGLWAKVAATKASTMASWGFAGSIRAVTAAMRANPIGWVIGLIGTLGGVITWAWNKFDTFRAVVKGVWESVKTIFKNTWDTIKFVPIRIINALLGIPRAVKDSFKNIGQIITAVFTGNLQKIPDLVKDLAKTNPLSTMGLELGKGAGDAFNDAFNKEMEEGSNERKDKDIEAPGQSGRSQPDMAGGQAAGQQEGGQLEAGIAGVSGSGSSGGPKHVTINIEKLIEQFSISTSKIEQSKSRIKDMVNEALLQAVNNANVAASQ